jgi:protein SDA1
MQGTLSTRKKKKRKLKRMMGTLEKAKRKGQSRPEDSFAAMQLLHDPQSFADRLLANCQGHNMSFDNRLVMMQVISRVIGVHELILENFYPFVQRYLQPSQREVVSVLAIAVQSCHKLVPPTALQPVLKQVVDQFVHDRARPEVCTSTQAAVVCCLFYFPGHLLFVMPQRLYAGLELDS